MLSVQSQAATCSCPRLKHWNAPAPKRLKTLGYILAGHQVRDESRMQFILGVFLFVIVLGAVDAFLPWPRAKSRGRAQ